MSLMYLSLGDTLADTSNGYFERITLFLNAFIKLRMEMGNVSKRQQPEHRADNSRRSPTGLQCPLDVRSYPLYVRPYPFHVRLTYVLSVDVRSVYWKILSMFKTLNGRPLDKVSVEPPEGVLLDATSPFRFCFVSVTCPLYIHWRSGRQIHQRTSTGRLTDKTNVERI